MCFVLSPFFLVCSAYKYAAWSFFFSVGGQETQAQSGFKGTVQPAIVSPDKSEYGLKLTVVGGCQNMVVAVRIQYGCRRL